MQTNIPSNLQSNIEQVKPAPYKYNIKYYIEAITFNFSNKDNYLWNDMITFLSANFAQANATHTKFWCKLNNQTEPKTNNSKILLSIVLIFLTTVAL